MFDIGGYILYNSEENKFIIGQFEVFYSSRPTQGESDYEQKIY